MAAGPTGTLLVAVPLGDQPPLESSDTHPAVGNPLAAQQWGREGRWSCPAPGARFPGRMLKYSPLRGVGVVRRCQKSKGQLSAAIL